jgi:NAD+ kinase
MAGKILGEMKISCIASDSRSGQEGYELLKDKFNFVSLEEADVIIALGGDGFMLHTLHTYIHLAKPIYGMNRGTVGFLMNSYCVQ